MYKLAIVGATGLVGKTILKILEEKNLPIYEYVLFSSKKSAGKIFPDIHRITSFPAVCNFRYLRKCYNSCSNIFVWLT